MPAVELVDVTRSFGAVRAVRGLSFRVEPGELVSILGPSGCGKSTTLQLIAGVLLPDEGGRIERRVDPAPARSHGGGLVLVAHGETLPPDRTVEQCLADASRRAGVPAEQVAEQVREGTARFGLDADGVGGRLPAQLSAGQRQRVVLARAVALRPALLLLDDPLSGLDPALRRRMQLAVATLPRELGTTVVLATQDREEARALGGRVVELSGGALVHVGPAQVDDEHPAVVAAHLTDALQTQWRRAELGTRTAWVARGREVLAASPPEVRARLAVQLAYELGRQGRWEESRAVAAPVEGAPPSVHAELWRARIMALGTLGRLVEARDEAARLFTWAEASGDPAARAHAHHAEATARLSRGEPVDALVDAGVALAREVGDAHTHLALLTVRANHAADSARAAEAWREVEALARATGHRPKELLARFRVAAIGRRADPEAALAELAAIGHAADTAELAKLRVMVRGTSALILAERGDAGAEQALREVIAAAELQGFREATNTARLNLSDLLASQGRVEEALVHVDAVRRGPSSDRHRQEAARRHATLTGEPSPTLELATDGAWFSWRGVRVDLPVRSPLRRLLVALATGEAGTADALTEAGWPGERMHPESARNRLHVALSTLRRKGLGDTLRTTEAGWVLEPEVLVRWVGPVDPTR